MLYGMSGLCIDCLHFFAFFFIIINLTICNEHSCICLYMFISMVFPNNGLVDLCNYIKVGENITGFRL